MNLKLFKTAAINATVTAAYIVLVASALFYAENMNIKEPSVLIPIFMLMLLVFSATLTGSLMLGKPILWYIDGKKKEALSLLSYTVSIFFGIMLIALCIMLLVGTR